MPVITASDLYALTQGKTNSCDLSIRNPKFPKEKPEWLSVDPFAGEHECYWCGSKCSRENKHNIPSISVISRIVMDQLRSMCKRPASPYLCWGCWLYRRQRITVNYLTNGRFKDGQAPCKHSWWITNEGAYGLRFEDYKTLYELLLKPPLTFVLALRSQKELDAKSQPDNHLQHFCLNNLPEIKTDTPLHFTMDGKDLTYTIYELENALTGGSNGREGGVQVLTSFLGAYDSPKQKEEPAPKKRGAPPKQEDRRQVTVTQSLKRA